MVSRDGSVQLNRVTITVLLAVVLVGAAGLAMVGTASAEDVNQCREINDPGTYTLTGDISAMNQTCIEITASDVMLDGQENNITFDGVTATGDGIAVGTPEDGTLTNVTVQDVTIEDFRQGIAYSGVENGEISNTTLVENEGDEGGGTGIALVDSSSNDILSNDANDNNLGIFLSGATDNTIQGNDIDGTTGSDGIGLYSASTGNTIENNEVSNAFNNGVILTAGSDDTTVTGNTLTNNTDDGVNVVETDGTEITDNTIKNNGGDARNGITITASAGTTIGANTITGNAGDGIQLAEANQSVVQDNEITDNGNAGIQTTTIGGTPATEPASGNQISNNEISNNDDSGILLGDGATNNDITENTVTDNLVGIELNTGDGNEIVDNDVTGNGNATFGAGVAVYSSTDNTISENTISNNSNGIETFTNSGDATDDAFENNNTYTDNVISDNPRAGVSLFYEENSMVENNTVTDSGTRGVFLFDSTENDVTGNTISDSGGDGLQFSGSAVLDGADDNTITDNTITTSSDAGVDMVDGSDNLIYDNLFKNTDNVQFNNNRAGSNAWNVEPRDETNVVGESVTGGNFYATPSADGFSETCSDSDGNLICDEDNDFGTGSDANTDFEPLAAASDIVTDPTSLDFSDVRVDGSATDTVTVSNEGNATLLVDMTILRGNTGAFSIAEEDRQFEVAPGEDYEVSLTFAPETEGAKAADLEIESNDPDESRRFVELSGDGVASDIDASPSELDFGNVNVADDKTWTVTVTNEGDASLSIDSTEITGQDNEMFEIVDGGPTDLAPGQQTEIDVEFDPDSTGAKTATLEIENDDTDSPVEVSLSGTGVQSDIAVDPTSIDFGTITSGESTTETVTITNEGSDELTVNSLDINGANAANFSVEDDTPFDLDADESREVDVTFTAGSTCNKAATLSIGSNDPEESNVGVSLTGEGRPGIVNGYDSQPTDPDGDCRYEDISGDGNFDIVDVQGLFVNRNALDDRADRAAFDFDTDDDGDVDVVDVQNLFVELTDE